MVENKDGCGQHAKIIGEEIATSFKMFDMHEKEKTIKLLGVSKWNGLIAKVNCFFFVSKLFPKKLIETDLLRIPKMTI